MVQDFLIPLLLSQFFMITVTATGGGGHPSNCLLDLSMKQQAEVTPQTRRELPAEQPNVGELLVRQAAGMPRRRGFALVVAELHGDEATDPDQGVRHVQHTAIGDHHE